MSQEHFGDCLYCGTSNSYSSFNCCSCHTQLPWAQALTQMLAQGQPQAQPQSQLAYAPPIHAQMQAPPGSFAPQPIASAAPKYCAHCGSGHSAGARFCSGCGTAILSAQLAQPADPPGASPRFAFGWPLQAQAAMPTALPTAQGQGGFMFSPHQSVNVNVVTEQKSEKKGRGRGWLSRLFVLFFTACAILATLALLGGAGPQFVMCATLAFFAGIIAALAK